VGQKGKDCGGIRALNYTKLIAVSTALLVSGITIISFVLSYNALLQVAADYGVTPRLSFLWPLLVDLSLVVFSLATVRAYLQNEGSWKQWALVGIYTAMTIGFNVLHASSGLMSQIVAAIPPISLFFSFELLMSQLKISVHKQGIIQNIEQLQLENNKQLQVIESHNNDIVRLDDILNTKQEQLTAIKANIKEAKSSQKNLGTSQETLQNGRQKKIAKRRQKVLALLQDGRTEQEILQEVNIKDLRTLRNDIKHLNGQTIAN
jgi:hypothetical protein